MFQFRSRRDRTLIGNGLPRWSLADSKELACFLQTFRRVIKKIVLLPMPADSDTETHLSEFFRDGLHVFDGKLDLNLFHATASQKHRARRQRTGRTESFSETSPAYWQ